MVKPADRHPAAYDGFGYFIYRCLQLSRVVMAVLSSVVAYIWWVRT